MIINNILTANDQLVLQSLLKQIKQLFKQLKYCQHAPIQSTIIWSIKPKCQQALTILNKCNESSQYIMKKKHVIQIKQKVEQVQKKLQENQSKRPQIGHGGRIVKIQADKNYNQDDLAAEMGLQIQNKSQQSQNKIFKYQKQSNNQNSLKQQRTQSQQQTQRSSISRASQQILRSIAMQQIKSTDLKYKKQELQEVLTRLQSNKQLMNHIEGMVIQQGNNLDKIEQHIQKAYSNVEGMNVQLNHAQKQQIKAVNKIRKAFQKTASCFWGFFLWPFRKIGKKKNQIQNPTPIQ